MQQNSPTGTQYSNLYFMWILLLTIPHQCVTIWYLILKQKLMKDFEDLSKLTDLKTFHWTTHLMKTVFAISYSYYKIGNCFPSKCFSSKPSRHIKDNGVTKENENVEQCWMFTDTTDANSLKSSKHTSSNFCNLYIWVLKDQKHAPKIILINCPYKESPSKTWSLV